MEEDRSLLSTHLNPNPSLLPTPSNPNDQTFVHKPINHVNQTKAMKNFKDFIFKLAETHPNKPLSPPVKTLLYDRLNCFVADYKTPTHLPYSAMIQRALEELNEKMGSTEDSISEYLEKIYDNLPFAHSALLKHHLEKLGESGEVVVTRDQRYALPGCLKSSSDYKKNSSGREGKSSSHTKKNSPGRKGKTNSLTVRGIRIKQNQEESEDEVIKSDHIFYEKKEQVLDGNATDVEDNTDLTETMVTGENGSILLLPGSSSIEVANEKKYLKDIVRSSARRVNTRYQQERDKCQFSSQSLGGSPGFDSIGVKNLPRSSARRVNTRYQQERDKCQFSSQSLGGSPGFDSIGVKNLPNTRCQQERNKCQFSSQSLEGSPDFDSIGVNNLPYSGSTSAGKSKVREQENHEEQLEPLRADIVEIPSSINGLKLKIKSNGFESADQPVKLQNQTKSVSLNEQIVEGNSGKQLRRSLRLNSNQPFP